MIGGIILTLRKAVSIYGIDVVLVHLRIGCTGQARRAEKVETAVDDALNEKEGKELSMAFICKIWRAEREAMKLRRAATPNGRDFIQDRTSAPAGRKNFASPSTSPPSETC